MSSFSEANLTEKLNSLNASQQSIQTLSLWLIHHRKHSKTIVLNWVKALRKAKPNKKLPFMYLANDVIQNSKKKGPEFHRDFKLVLCDAYRHAIKYVDYKSRQAMDRVLNIWKDRGVFEEALIDKIKKAMSDGMSKTSKSGVDTSSPAVVSDSAETTTPGSGNEENKPEGASKSKRSEDREREKREAKKRKKQSEMMPLKEEIEQEFANGPGEPPEPEELVKCLQELENSASSDAVVREQIAALPQQVSDLSKLDELRDKSEAIELCNTVDEAVSLLADYNTRLSTELQDRKKVAKMLRDYIAAQKSQLADSETRLQEYKNKLEKVDVVRKELKAHMQSLPDLTKLPGIDFGLAPLPSAGDLFTGK